MASKLTVREKVELIDIVVKWLLKHDNEIVCLHPEEKIAEEILTHIEKDHIIIKKDGKIDGKEEVRWKEFLRSCKYRKSESFGHYWCGITGIGCPRTRRHRCPEWRDKDEKIQQKS